MSENYLGNFLPIIISNETILSDEIEKILVSLPEHFKKENSLKLINCFKPIFEYLNKILDDDIGMSNINKAYNEYLDYIGYRMLVGRINMNNEEYRPFLKMMRFKSLNAPTTENLLKLAYDMTGFYPAETYFYPNGEPASQYIKFIVPYTTDLNKFPDLNQICDAGARIYQDILSKAHRSRYLPEWIPGKHQLRMNLEIYEVPAIGRSNV